MFAGGTVLPARIQPAHLRPLAYRVLSKKYGLSIKSDGLVALADIIGNQYGMEWRNNSETLKFLETFASVWKQQGRGLFVDEQGVREVITEIHERQKAQLKSNNNVLEQHTNHLANTKKNTNIVTLDKFLFKKPQISTKEQTPDSVTSNSLIPDSISSDQDQPNSNNSTDADSEDDYEIGTEQLRKQGGISLHEDNDPNSSYNASQVSIYDERLPNEEELNWKDYFKVINATEQQRFSYDSVKMQFKFNPLNRPKDSPISLPSINSNIKLFPTRYHLVKDRTLRNDNFKHNDALNPMSSMALLQKELSNGKTSDVSTYMSITPIKNLLGRDGQNFLLLGLLKRNSKGLWALEDPSGEVEIDISQAIPTKGLYYVPGCMVLVEGIYFTVGNKFHITSITHPPGERREKTLDTIGNLDLLGIHGQSSPNYIARLDKDLKIRLHYLEKELEDHKMVLLGGDIFLDELSTLEALKKVFIKLNEEPPTVVVFQGSFSSVPVHPSMTSKTVSSSSQYKNNFDTLANLLSQFNNITELSTLVFVPGVNDPWGSINSLGAAGTLPLKSIPSYFTQKMNRVCKNIIWGSNPTRIAYLSQEIVILRDDMADRFKRHRVIFPVEEDSKREKMEELREELEEVSLNDSTLINQLISDKEQLPNDVHQSRKYVKTILDQGHLSPFINSIRPIVWDLDHSLTLCPIPSTLIVCDTSAPRFDLTYNGCKSINSGRFIVNRKATYVEYTPSSKKSSKEEIYF